MGQILLVQAGPGRAAKPILDRGVALCRALAGISPSETHCEGHLGVAVFPRLDGAGARLRERASGSEILVGAGTWVCDGPSADAMENLERLLGESGSLEAAAQDVDGLSFVAVAGPESALCVTDRGGRLHVYSAEIEGAVVLATSALVLAALVDAAFDPLGCQEMLGTGNAFEHRSLFQGVSKLEPATAFLLRAGRIQSRARYWDVRSVFAASPPAASTVPALADALVAAVQSTLRPFERPIVDLTGGFDSRGVVAAAIASERPFRCVVNGGDEDGDVRSAEAIARTFGLELLRLRPGLDFGARSLAAIERSVVLTDGEFDAVEYSDILAIHERLARQGDATVNGSAGEICRGYWWDLLFPHAGSKDHFDDRKAARRFVPDDWVDGIAARVERPLVEHFEDVVRRTNAGLEDLPNTARADNIYLNLRMHRWAGRLASATDRIWPCATPFMFRKPLAIALTAPMDVRARNRMARRLVEHLNPKLAKLPMAGGYPASPLRLGNAYRFLPLLRETASKAAGRIGRSLKRPAADASKPSAAADLWAQDDIRTVLDPATMKTASLYRSEALADFLRSSQAPGFTEIKKLGRILTLELAAQAVARARKGAPE